MDLPLNDRNEQNLIFIVKNKPKQPNNSPNKKIQTPTKTNKKKTPNQTKPKRTTPLSPKPKPWKSLALIFPYPKYSKCFFLKRNVEICCSSLLKQNARLWKAWWVVLYYGLNDLEILGIDWRYTLGRIFNLQL